MQPKVGLDRSRTGRARGTPNKTTSLLKDAVLKAAEQAGGGEGLIGCLAKQAEANPGPFMALLGKVLPMQVSLSWSELRTGDHAYLASFIMEKRPRRCRVPLDQTSQ